jgi:hypothetical protein
LNPRYWPALAVCALWLCLVGCGFDPLSSHLHTSDACTGAVITGVLHDSLTGQPVAQGWIFLESGNPLPGTRIYNFSTAQQTTTHDDGTFSICASAIPTPSVIVATALDSSNKAYPMFVAPVSGEIDLGTILMGGCTVICAFEGQQQTSYPAEIEGVITTAPIAGRGSVVPQYSISAPDAAATLWSLTVPSFDSSQSFTFATAATGCTEGVPFCAAYSFLVPSQKPLLAIKGGYTQGTGAPVYSIIASVTDTPSCTPPFAFTSFQQDGTSPLTGTPGVKLTAATISFSRCQ